MTDARTDTGEDISTNALHRSMVAGRMSEGVIKK